MTWGNLLEGQERIQPPANYNKSVRCSRSSISAAAGIGCINFEYTDGFLNSMEKVWLSKCKCQSLHLNKQWTQWCSPYPLNNNWPHGRLMEIQRRGGLDRHDTPTDREGQKSGSWTRNHSLLDSLIRSPAGASRISTLRLSTHDILEMFGCLDRLILMLVLVTV